MPNPDCLLLTLVSDPPWRGPSIQRADFFYLGDFKQSVGHSLITYS